MGLSQPAGSGGNAGSDTIHGSIAAGTIVGHASSSPPPRATSSPPAHHGGHQVAQATQTSQSVPASIQRLGSQAVQAYRNTVAISSPSFGLHASGSPSSSPLQRSSSSSSVSITQNPAATGMDQLPQSIQNELLSGKLASYTNPNTGQTWYAPHTISDSGSIWLNGPGYSGPVNVNGGGMATINRDGDVIPVTALPTTSITQGGKTVYSGPQLTAPMLTFSAAGKFEGAESTLPTSWLPAPNSGYQTVDTPGGQVSLPTTMMSGALVETGSWSSSPTGPIFTPSSYQFANGQNYVTLTNPTVKDLEDYGIQKYQAQEWVNSASPGSNLILTLTITPDGRLGMWYGNPPMSQQQASQIEKTGVLQAGTLEELSPTATVSIGGKAYNTNDLIALYNYLHGQTTALPVPQAGFYEKTSGGQLASAQPYYPSGAATISSMPSVPQSSFIQDAQISWTADPVSGAPYGNYTVTYTAPNGHTYTVTGTMIPSLGPNWSAGANYNKDLSDYYAYDSAYQAIFGTPYTIGGATANAYRAMPKGGTINADTGAAQANTNAPSSLPYVSTPSPSMSAGYYLVGGTVVNVSDPNSYFAKNQPAGQVYYLGTDEQNAESMASFLESGKPIGIVFNRNNNNPTVVQSAGGSGNNPYADMTIWQGLGWTNAAAAEGNARIPSSQAVDALDMLLTMSGASPGAISSLVSGMTPSQWAELISNTPYTIYTNTPQGITSTYVSNNNDANTVLNTAYSNLQSMPSGSNPKNYFLDKTMSGLTPSEFANDTTIIQEPNGYYKVTTQTPNGFSYTQTVPGPNLPTTSTTATPNGPVYSFTMAQQPQSVPPLSLEQLGDQSIPAQAISPDTIMLPQTAWQYSLPYIGQLPKVSDSKTFADLLLSQPQSAAAPIYGTTTVGGNIPTALSMPGTGGLSMMPNAADLYPGMGTLSTNPILGQSTQYTNTTQASSSNPWLQGLSLIPGEVASTFGGLVKGAFSPEDFTPVGFTPGAAPTARGHFPYRLSGPIHLSVAQIQYRNRSQARICSHGSGRKLSILRNLRPRQRLHIRAGQCLRQCLRQCLSDIGNLCGSHGPGRKLSAVCNLRPQQRLHIRA